MESASMPTMRLFTDYIQPLRDLGYLYAEVAYFDGLLTEQEYNFLSRYTGRYHALPSFAEFVEIQRQSMQEIASIIN